MEQLAGRGYLRAWDAMGTLLKEGRSWSGNERNVCFLNSRDGRFVNVSHLSGIDHVADSRALAIVDWDHDGDLDLWFANRTAPRLRWMQNDTAGNEKDVPANFVAFHLQGVTCNRDAIGARIEVFADAASPDVRSIRTLRAGEGYLAQSSKWLHFGLGSAKRVVRAVVTWPGGKQQRFHDLKINRRYLIREGRSKALAVTQRSGKIRSPNAALVANASTASQPPKAPDTVRIVPHRPVPVPRLPYLNLQQQHMLFDTSNRQPTLLVLWATWCQPCIAELAELHDNQDRLQKHGLDVLTLNVDNAQTDLSDRVEGVKGVLGKLGRSSFRTGLAEASTLERLDIMQRVLIGVQRPLAIPASFLLTADKRLAAVYKGRVNVERLLKDVSTLTSVDEPVDHRLLLPFAGRFFVNRLPPDLLAVPEKLLQLNDAQEALYYVQQHIGSGELTPTNAGFSESQLADLLTRIGIQLARQQDRQQALATLQRAIRIKPDHYQAFAAKASLFQALQRPSAALKTYRRMAELRPTDLTVKNNIAWILATSPAAGVRSPQDAIALAEAVCETTNYQVVSSLDTLAAAYASAQQFEQAIKTIDRAIARAREKQRTTDIQRLEKRKRLYQQSRPYVDQSNGRSD